MSGLVSPNIEKQVEQTIYLRRIYFWCEAQEDSQAKEESIIEVYDEVKEKDHESLVVDKLQALVEERRKELLFMSQERTSTSWSSSESRSICSHLWLKIEL